MKTFIIACVAAVAGMALSAKDLTWSSGNWNTSDSSWTDAGGNPAAFSAGDNVRFAKGGSLTLSDNVEPGDVIFDIPSGQTLTITFHNGCMIKATATSFRKTGEGSLAFTSDTNDNGTTGIGVTCGVVIEAGDISFLRANTVRHANQNETNWWRVKNGATLKVCNRNAVGNAAGIKTMNLYVERGGTLHFQNNDNVHCSNAFRCLTMEGGANLTSGGKGADDYGLVHVADTFCVTGDEPLTLTGSSAYANQMFMLAYGAKPTVFDVADVTGNSTTDFTLDMWFMRGGASQTAGLLKKGDGTMLLARRTDANGCPNGDISIMDGVLQFAVQDQLLGQFDRTVYVSTNATLHYAMRNIQNGNDFDNTGFNLKIVVDHGMFLIEHRDGGHNYLGKELTLIDGTLRNTMNGFNSGSSGLALMTIGKRITLKGTRAYDLKTYGVSNQQVHLWGTNTTEFVVDDIVTGGATDATINWTLIDRWNTNTSNAGAEQSGFVKLGEGTLSLASSGNTFSGDVAVSNGTLRVDGDIGVSACVNVADGGFIGGTGTVNNVVVESGGGFAAQDTQRSPLRIRGNLTLPSVGEVRLWTATGDAPSKRSAIIADVTGTMSAPPDFSGWKVYLDGVDMSRHGYSLRIVDGKIRAGKVQGLIISVN